MQTLVTATRQALEGLEQAISEDLRNARKLLSCAERWAAKGGGKASPKIAKYARLAALEHDTTSTCLCGTCKTCKAGDELRRGYFSRTLDIDSPVMNILDLIVGRSPHLDLDTALEMLASTIAETTNNRHVTQAIMAHAYAAAGYVPCEAPADSVTANGSPFPDDIDRDVAELSRLAAARDARSAEIDRQLQSVGDQLSVIAAAMSAQRASRTPALRLLQGGKA